MEGGSYRADCLGGGKGRSLKIEIGDGKAGVGFDHATGEVVGGPIDIFAAVHGYECRGESFRRLVERMASEMGISAPLKPNGHATVYHYQTKNGAPWCEVHRAAGKVIRPFDPATGQYGKPAFPIKAPLYRLDEVMGSSAVLVVEGEKCVEAARGAGLVATTSIGGTNAYARTDWSSLAGKTVTIWPDNDDPGKKYADAVARLAADAGAESVCLVSLPKDAPLKWDIADAVDQGLDIEALLKNVEAYQEGWDDPWKDRDLGVSCLADLEHKPQRARDWVIDQWLPRGQLCSIYGPAGHGKSLIAHQLAMHVASGTDFFDMPVNSGNVLCIFGENDELSVENSTRDILRGTKISAYGRLKNFHYICVDNKPSDIKTLTMINFPSNGKPNTDWPINSWLESYARRYKPVLIVLDTISHIFGGSENDREQVYYFGQYLADFCQRYQTTVLMIGHYRKAGDTFSGSTAWEGCVRAMLSFEKIDKEAMTSPNRLAIAKANYSKRAELVVRWEQGAFVLNSRMSDEQIREREAQSDQIKTKIRDALTFFTNANVRTTQNDGQAALWRKMADNDFIEPSEIKQVRKTIFRMIEAGEISTEGVWRNASYNKLQCLELVSS